jgi:hypothetical protein
MKRFAEPVIAAALAISIISWPGASKADNGQIAAGVIGGLVIGTLFGGAMSQPRYYAPAPVYVAPPPQPVSCYWTRGEPVWDDYRGIWIRPPVQVCD